MSFHGMDLPVNAAIAVPNPNFSIPTLLMTLGTFLQNPAIDLKATCSEITRSEHSYLPLHIIEFSVMMN